MKRPPARSRWWVRLLQVVASVAILGGLLAGADLGALGEALARTSWPLLALALLCKAVAITLHEMRVWIALPSPRIAIGKMLGIGFSAGALNLVLPGRGGDVAAVALLHREAGVPAGRATAAVAIGSFVEAAVFGAMLLGVLLFGAARWELVVGQAAHRQALQMVTLVTLGGVAVAIGTVILGKVWARRGKPEPARESPARKIVGFIRDAVTSTGSGLSDLGLLAANTAAALVQVLLVVTAVSLALPAIGLDVPLPWLAASGVLAISAFAAVALPATFGAGPAAASVAVLHVFGVGQADALAYAVLWWVIAQLPPVAFGLPAIWRRRLGR